MLKFFFLVLFGSLTFGENNGNRKVPLKSPINYQDGPFVSSDNPLKGFSSFIFFPLFHSLKKEDREKALELIASKLSKIGKVTQITFSSPYDLSVFDKGPSLYFEIGSLDSIECKIPVLRASLNLASNIQIFKTHNECLVYIWSKNHFMNGDIQKRPIEAISQSLDSLLQTFVDKHSLANPLQKDPLNFYLFYDAQKK